MASRAVTALDLPRFDAVSLQMSGDFLLVELCQLEAIVVQVSAPHLGRGTSGSTNRSLYIHKIYQGGPHTKLGQPYAWKNPLDAGVQYGDVPAHGALFV
jgi:hypothetical protein